MRQELINRAALRLDVDREVIGQVWDAYWLYIRYKIDSLPDLYSLEEGDREKIKCNFNMPHFGKFHCSFKYIDKIKMDRRIKNAEHKESEVDEQPSADNGKQVC